MIRTKIKICGLFRLCDAYYVNCAMPDYVGFVFYEKSHRKITIEQALELRLHIHPEIKTVGVFVDAPKEKIVQLCKERIIDVIQLHGREDNHYISELRNKVPNQEIWKTFQISSKKDLQLAKQSSADMVLLDNGYGTGKSFDWSLLDGFTQPFILAGGLSPMNIPNAIEKFHPYVVDISSGVESDGLKDKNKIFEAVNAVKINVKRNI